MALTRTNDYYHHHHHHHHHQLNHHLIYTLVSKVVWSLIVSNKSLNIFLVFPIFDPYSANLVVFIYS
jgi:hypothetical protein